jgi:hypothetical protein
LKVTVLELAGMVTCQCVASIWVIVGPVPVSEHVDPPLLQNFALLLGSGDWVVKMRSREVFGEIGFPKASWRCAVMTPDTVPAVNVTAGARMAIFEAMEGVVTVTDCVTALPHEPPQLALGLAVMVFVSAFSW